MAGQRGRPEVDDEDKKKNFVTLRLSDNEMRMLEDVRSFLEKTQDRRVTFVKKKISIRDAISYLIHHGQTYYKQDQRLKASKE